MVLHVVGMYVMHVCCSVLYCMCVFDIEFSMVYCSVCIVLYCIELYGIAIVYNVIYGTVMYRMYVCVP